MILVAFLNTLRLAKLIEGALATAGGFLVGYLLVMVLGWWIDKYLLKKKSPELLHRCCRLLGGLILAILVAMMLFGGGGGEGNGDGDGKGNNKSSPIDGTLDPAATDAEPKPVPTKAKPPAEERVRVTMLGGTDVKDQKFYLIDDDATPRTLADVKAAVQRKRETTTRTLGLEIVFAKQNKLPQEHAAVTQLSGWASNVAGLTVTFPAETP